MSSLLRSGDRCIPPFASSLGPLFPSPLARGLPKAQDAVSVASGLTQEDSRKHRMLYPLPTAPRTRTPESAGCCILCQRPHARGPPKVQDAVSLPSHVLRSGGRCLHPIAPSLAPANLPLFSTSYLLRLLRVLAAATAAYSTTTPLACISPCAPGALPFYLRLSSVYPSPPHLP